MRENMDNEPLTIYKLIILYMLSKVDAPLPSGVISDYITSRGYTNFFTLQNAFGELLRSELIAEQTTYHLAYYTLSDTGRETLDSFGGSLSHSIRQEIDNFLSEKRFEIADETAYISDYQKTPDNTYLATCTLKEGNYILFELSLDAATEEDAIRICDNWRDASTELYQMALQKLLKKG